MLVSQDEGQGSAGSRTHRCGHGARRALQPSLLLEACSQSPRDCRAPLRLRLGDGTPAAGATDHRPSWSPRGSPGRAEPARREAGASSQADLLPGAAGPEAAPSGPAPQPRPGPVHPSGHQEPSPDFCGQGLHRASPGLTQLLRRWAPDPPGTSLPARSPSCPNMEAFCSWFEVLGFGIPHCRVSDSQLLAPRFSI